MTYAFIIAIISLTVIISVIGVFAVFFLLKKRKEKMVLNQKQHEKNNTQIEIQKGLLSNMMKSESHRNKISLDLNDWFVDVNDEQLQVQVTPLSYVVDIAEDTEVTTIAIKLKKLKRTLSCVIVALLLAIVGAAAFCLIKDYYW